MTTMTDTDTLPLVDDMPDEWAEPPESMRTAAAQGIPTKMTYQDDGRVFGHVAAYNVPLRDGRGNDWSIPTDLDLAAGMQGYVRTASGKDIKTGIILTDRNHTDVKTPLSAALQVWNPFARREPEVKPMENTGAMLASVVYGYDEVGIWAAGTLLPGTTKSQLTKARAAAVSLECWPDPTQPSGYSMLGCQCVGVPGLSLSADAMPRAASVVLGDPMVAASSGVKIKKGDTLSALAKTHGTTVKELMKANPQIKDANKIYAGKALTLPAKPKAPAKSKSTTTPHADTSSLAGIEKASKSTTTNSSGETRPTDNATGNTTAPGSGKTAKMREELKALTARTKAERKAIYDSAAAESKSSPGQSARIREAKKAKLDALRTKAKAEADSIRARAKTAAPGETIAEFIVSDEGVFLAELVDVDARTAAARYEARPADLFPHGALVLVPGGRARAVGMSTLLDGTRLVNVQMVSEDGVIEAEYDDSIVVPIDQVQATGLELRYVEEVGGCEVPSRPISASPMDGALPEVEEPTSIILQTVLDRLNAIDERLDMLEERANAPEPEPGSAPAVASAGEGTVEAIDLDEYEAELVGVLGDMTISTLTNFEGAAS